MALTRYGDRNYFGSPARIDTQTDGTLQVYAYGDGFYKLAGGTLTKLADPVGYYGGLSALSDGGTLLYTQNGEFGGASFTVLNADGTVRIAVGDAGAGAAPDGPDDGTANDDAGIRGPSAVATAGGGFFIGYQDTTYSNQPVSLTYPYPTQVNGQTVTAVGTTTTSRDFDVSHRFYAADGSASQPLTIDNTGAYSNGYTSTDHTAGRQLLADTTGLGTGGIVEVYRDQIFFDGSEGGTPSRNASQTVLTARIVTPDGTSGPIQLNDEPLNNDPFSAAQAADPGYYSGVELVSLSDGFAAIWSETSRFADSSVFGGYRTQGTDTKIRYFDNLGNALTGEITILHRDTGQGNIPLRVSADALSDGRIAVAFQAGVDGANGSGASDLFVETIGPRGSSLSANLITPGLTTGQGPGFDWALSALSGTNVALTYYDAAYDLANPGPTSANVVETYAVGAQTGAVRFGTNAGDTLTGTADTDLLYGYAGSDSLSGGAGRDFLDGGFGNDVLDGGTGADIMLGGDGADTYYVDNTGDRVRDDGYINDISGARAVDTVYASADWFAEYASQVERIVANAGNRGLKLGTDIPDATIVGGAGADTLDGSTGSFQTLIGGAGNDTYYVGGTYYYVPGSDTVIEAAGQGTDTVYARTDFTLGTDQSIEFLRADAGTTGLALTGNTLAQSIYGGAGADTLDGGGGADRLFGGLGDDVYVVNNAGVVVTEAADSGLDTVRASGNFTLGANLENLVLTGAGGNGYGNGLANTLTGNDGNNVLDGKGGADRMIGGVGNDTYTVDNAGDVVVEAANQGTDKVLASVSYTLAANVERLELVGASNIAGTGNDAINTIIGSGAANTLTGLGGRDTLTGGAGRDTFVFASLSDSTVSTGGRDTITDFTQGDTDRIDLRSIDANTSQSATGDQAFTWIGASAFTGAAGQLHYEASGNDTLVSGDIDGNGAADFAILFTGQIALTRGDFLL